MDAALARPQQLWFLNTRVTIRISYTEGADEISVLEHWAPHGDSPPLHVHQHEDEVFHILEGEFRFRVGDRELRARAGEPLLGPKGAPHSYLVESLEGGRMLTITRGQDFERFVRGHLAVRQSGTGYRSVRDHPRPSRCRLWPPHARSTGSNWSALHWGGVGHGPAEPYSRPKHLIESHAAPARLRGP